MKKRKRRIIQPQPLECLYTAHEIAKILKVSISFVRNHTKSGDLPVFRIGAACRYYLPRIIRVLEERSGK